MNIVFVLASLGSGGAERVVSLLANKMVESGHQVEIICLKFNDVYYQTDSCVKVTLAMQKTKNRFTELFWLRKYLKKQNPDVVIPFTEGVYCFTILSLLGTGIPIIASERLDPAAMSKTRKILKRLLLPYADWLVVQTQSIKDYFPKSIQKKTSIIYNPVNDESLSPTLPSREGRLNRIISVGRLYPQKNQAMMIRAFAKVADEFPDWQLVIYGEGPLRAELEFLVSSFKLQNRVFLPGRTEHVIEELRKSKIFCMSSDYEGMSNAMIEAICVGLPIVTTNVSGVNELVVDGENGFIVPCKNAIAMSNAIKAIIENKYMMESFSIKSKGKSSIFKLDFIVNQWEQLIRNSVILH